MNFVDQTDERLVRQLAERRDCGTGCEDAETFGQDHTRSRRGQGKFVKARLRLAAWCARLIPGNVALRMYDVPWLAGSIRQILNALVPQEPEAVEVARGPLAGVRLILDLRREKYLWLGTYEPWVQDVIVARLRPGDVAWDIGAFVGYHTLLMRRVCGPGSVVAVEPDTSNRARLVVNLAANGATDVYVVGKAVGAREGTARLRRHEVHAPQAQVAADGEIDRGADDHPGPSARAVRSSSSREDRRRACGGGGPPRSRAVAPRGAAGLARGTPWRGGPARDGTSR